MAGLQDIRRRIRSVRNTQQVTKAMKMISAVKLRKSQERLLALRPYSDRLHDLVNRVVGRFALDPSLVRGLAARAFLNPREERRIRVVVVASDKGLCGGFNGALLKTAQAFLEARAPEDVVLDVVGKRAVDWARKTGRKRATEHTGLAVPSVIRTVHEIGIRVARQYRDGEIDALYIAYNHFNSAVSQTPTVRRIFPMDPPQRGVLPSEQIPHLLEPDPNTVLDELLPRFVETELIRALLESLASEHGARMAAMDKATNNAQEMIDKLTLHMNKMRQASITNQIIEIVSGAAS